MILFYYFVSLDEIFRSFWLIIEKDFVFELFDFESWDYEVAFVSLLQLIYWNFN